jgi:hypothetical protein
MKKLLLTSFLIFPILFLANFAQADSSDNISGFAWSENIGWVSFNCDNSELAEPRCDGANDYGVNIGIDGILSGDAWSENIGWITFNKENTQPGNDLTGCPIGACQAQVDLVTGQVSGWARVLAYDGGWDGWIKLTGVAQDGNPYGVSIDTITGDFSGYAWSDMVVGWLSFSGAGYKTETDYSFNPAPYVESGTTNIVQNYCGVFASIGQTSFSWTYRDDDLPVGEYQTQYRIQITRSSDQNFLSPVIDCTTTQSVAPGGTGSSGTVIVTSSPIYDCSAANLELAYNTSYLWRVKVKDANAWSTDFYPLAGMLFTTASHPYPYVNFSFLPARPTIGEVVSFTNESLCYNNSLEEVSCSSYLWEIIQGSGEFASGTDQYAENPYIKFSTQNNEVELTVEDSDGNQCSDDISVSNMLPLPEWIESSPTGFVGKLLAKFSSFLEF